MALFSPPGRYTGNNSLFKGGRSSDLHAAIGNHMDQKKRMVFVSLLGTRQTWVLEHELLTQNAQLN